MALMTDVQSFLFMLYSVCISTFAQVTYILSLPLAWDEQTPRCLPFPCGLKTVEALFTVDDLE
jgi:hypothetical protein